MAEQKKILIISQVYVPDPAAVGQYLHDAARELVNRNWKVIVYTANRGYDDPAIRYKKQEQVDGVFVKRFPLSSFGKNYFVARLAAALIFIIQVVFHGLTLRNPDRVLVSTSPPMASLAAVIIAMIKRVPVKYWVMDINPDQAIALGLINKDSWVVKIFNWFNRQILGSVKNVITLDEDMKARLMRKLEVNEKLSVIPPWPLQEHFGQPESNVNTFRLKHDLIDKFIFMYSGNHTLTNPLTTFIEAALALQNEDKVVFLFVGGGLGKAEIDDLIHKQQPPNIMSLPYQPFEELGLLLAAADVHLVSVGEKTIGVVHPSKIYGATAAGRPIFLIGPEKCHASTLVRNHNLGWQVEHGDYRGAIKIIREIISTPAEKLLETGRRARKLTETEYNRDSLLQQFCDIIER